MHLTGLCLYPVKGMRGIPLSSAAAKPCGLAGDRRWMVVDAQGRFLTQRQLPALALFDATLSQPASDPTLSLTVGQDRIEVAWPPTEGGDRIAVTVWRSQVTATPAGPETDRWLSAHLRRPCRLVFLDDARARPIEATFAGPGEHVSFADGFPILLASTASLAVLNQALSVPIGMERFRPNLVVDGANAWAEDGWRLLRIGGSLFRGARPCVRCAVTGIDQQNGETPQPGEPLRTLARLNRQPNGIVFGLNLIPRRHCHLNVGDAVEILE